MKVKTIRRELDKKFKRFLESIDDAQVKEHVKKNTIITGGCIASMLIGEKVNDYDLYFRDKETTAIVAGYYAKKFKEHSSASNKPAMEVIDDNGRIKIMVKSAGIASSEEPTAVYRYFETLPTTEADRAGEYINDIAKGLEKSDKDEKYKPVFLSSNAITLSGDIQLVIRFYGSPTDIHDNFDFIHCTNYWTSWDNKLELNKDALSSLITKELRYMGSKYPLCSIIRTRKFIRRDWTVNAGQYLKMAMQLNNLDLSDIKILEEQLIGVDAAYFMEVMSKLKEKGMDKVDSAYLVEVIDRIF